jgi:PAS domain S-box-containing protein
MTTPRTRDNGRPPTPGSPPARAGEACPACGAAADPLGSLNELLPLILDNMGDGLVVADEHGKLVFFNPAAERVLGLGVTDAPLDEWSQTYGVYHPITGQLYPSQDLPLARALRGEEANQVELFIRHADLPAGAHVSVTARPLRDADGRIRGGVAVVRDITTSKKLEQQLSLKTLLVQALMDHVPDTIYFKDVNGRYIRINRALCREFGLANPTAAANKTDADFYHPDYAEETRHAEREILRTGEPLLNREVKQKWRDGRERWVSITRMPLKDDDGHLVGTFGIARDVTEHIHAVNALQESERRFRDLFNRSPDGIFVETYDGVILDVNPAACRLHNMGRDELVGHNILEFLPESERERAVAGLRRMIRGEREHVESLTWPRTESPGLPAGSAGRWGEPIPVELMSSRVDYGGIPAQLLHVRDIRLRRRQEEQLHKLSRAVDQIADAVLITDKQGLIQYVNPAFEQMTGYDRADVFGNTPRVVKSGHHDRDFYHRLWATILSGRNFRAVITNRKKDGELFYADTTITPLKDQGGNVTHFVASWKDITESKHAQDELHRSQERFALAVQGSNDGIWDWDLTHDEVYFSPRWKNMLGYEDHEIFNKSSEWSSRIHPDDVHRTLGVLNTYLDGNLPGYEIEHRLRHKDGSYRWILSRGVAFRDADGKPYRMAGSHTDITRLKETEAELRHARDVAEEASRAKSQFLANVSHEVRTPLNGILGMTQLALETLLTAEQRDYLLTTKASVDLLLGVINDILDFSKIEAGKLDLDPHEFSLRHELGATLKSLAVRAHGKGLELGYRVTEDVPDALVGDWLRLRQVVVNLVGNAVKFTEEGEVIVRVTQEQSALRRRGEAANGEPPEGAPCHLHFQVRDSGIGIPPEKQRVIFEPFTQGDGSTTRKYGGTGLGLSISDKLVQLMGGRLWVESAPGRGSTFHFTVPLRPAPGAAPPPAPRRELDQRRALIVDDSAAEGAILAEILEEWGAAADAATSGARAAAALEDARAAGSPYELLLIDTMMPGLSGIAFAERVLRSGNVPAVVLMLTTTDRADLRDRCRELRLPSQVVKPVNPAELLPAIRTAFAHARGEPIPAPPVEPAAGGRPGPRRRLRLLVAEDNSVNQKLMRALLQKEGHTLVVVATGTEAVEAARRGRFDAILMDVQMPEMDGLEATARIRDAEAGTGRRVPIIAMTAHAMIGDRERCLQAGMDGYLAKPLDARLLSQTLGELADGPEPAAPPEPDGKKVIDREASLARVGRDEELLGTLIELFEAESLAWLEDVRRAAAAGDAVKLRRAAHTLKGAAASFGAEETCAAAQHLEEMGRRARLDGAEVALAELESALTRLRGALPGLRGARSEETEP